VPTITQVEENIRDLATKVLTVAEDANRPWSERKPELDKMESDIKALEETHASLKAESEARKRFADAAGHADANELPATTVARQADGLKSIGAQFVESDGYKAAVAAAGGRFTAAVDVKAFEDADTKATFTRAAGGAGGLIPDYLPGVTNVLFRRLTIADLLPSGTANGASIIYLKESSVTNAAAAVAEGGAKPGSDLNLTQVTENFTKVATTLKISDEMLQDWAATMSYVNGRLVLFVQLSEEDQLLNGSGSGANMTGLLNRSGKTAAQALGSDTAPDAIYKEITKIRTNAFVEPDGIVISPNNWQTIRLSKDANGQYYAGGPFTGAYGNAGGMAPDMLWGKPVVVTPANADGTARVGAFQPCTQRFVKGGLRVEMTNSNEDDFLKNLVAVRAEIREALVVYRPAGLGTVTGLA
jgi:HK97 family phage major capsid protein